MGNKVSSDNFNENNISQQLAQQGIQPDLTVLLLHVIVVVDRNGNNLLENDGGRAIQLIGDNQGRIPLQNEKDDDHIGSSLGNMHLCSRNGQVYICSNRFGERPLGGSDGNVWLQRDQTGRIRMSDRQQANVRLHSNNGKLFLQRFGQNITNNGSVADLLRGGLSYHRSNDLFDGIAGVDCCDRYDDCESLSASSSSSSSSCSRPRYCGPRWNGCDYWNPRYQHNKSNSSCQEDSSDEHSNYGGHYRNHGQRY